MSVLAAAAIAAFLAGEPAAAAPGQAADRCERMPDAAPPETGRASDPAPAAAATAPEPEPPADADEDVVRNLDLVEKLDLLDRLELFDPRGE